MRFAAGAELDPRLQAQWGDPLSKGEDYVLSTPDGSGNWGYTHTATQCVAAMKVDELVILVAPGFGG